MELVQCQDLKDLVPAIRDLEARDLEQEVKALELAAKDSVVWEVDQWEEECQDTEWEEACPLLGWECSSLWVVACLDNRILQECSTQELATMEECNSLTQ